MKTKRLLTGVAAMSALALTSCTNNTYTDNSMRTLRYEAGSTAGGKFVNCVEPGKKLASNDKFYPYPTTQREDVWDTDNYHKGSGSADHPDLEITDKNGVKNYVKMKISFFLNTDCTPIKVGKKTYKGGTLQVFHELIGKTRKAYFRSDGSYGGEKSGWIWAMDNYISSSAIDYMTRNARPNTAQALWLDTKVQDKLQTGLDKELPKLINDGMETDLEFYKDFTVKIYKITPEEEYTGLYKERQNAKIKAETAEANRTTRVAEAKADAAVAAEQAKVKQNEARGYTGPAGEQLLKKLLINKGGNPYQPTYVVGGSAPSK